MSYADKDQNRKHYRERYQELRRQGLCSQCAKIKTPLAVCLFCRETRNERRRWKRKPQKAGTRVARYHRLRSQGLCTVCGLESDGKARCPTCRGKECAGRAGKRTAPIMLLKALLRENPQFA